MNRNLLLLATIGVIAVAFHVVAAETNNLSPYDQGVACIKRKAWDQAITNFDEAIRIDTNSAAAFEYRGSAHFAKDDFEKAVDDFTRALRSDPKNSLVFFNRAGAYRANREFDKAILDYTESLRLSPTNYMAYDCRAACFDATGDFDREIKDWNEGLRLNPSDALALTMRGFAFFKTGRFDEALQDYRDAIRVDPKNDRAYNNLAWLLATCPVASLRDGEEAVEDATKACQLTNWSRWEWIDTLAAAYAEVGDFKKALEFQHRALDTKGVKNADRVVMQRRLLLYEHREPDHEGQRE